MRLIAATTAGILSMALATGAAVSAEKFDAKKHFEGRTIRIMVGFRAGGGTDLQARHFAAHWGKYIPGHPRITVANVTPSITASNKLYGSEPDGLTLKFTASANVVDQFNSKSAKYKVQEFRAIGTHTGSSSMMFATKSVPYKTIRDAIGGKTPIRIGFRSPDTAAAMRVAALSEWLNIPFKFVPGIAGTSKNLLALERGDTDAYMPGGGGTVWYSMPTIRPGWLTDGFVRPFLLTGPKSVKITANRVMELPDSVPFAVDLLKDMPERQKMWSALATADARFGKVIFAPPGTPDPIVDTLREAYREVLDDKPFRQKLEQIMGSPVEFMDGATVEKEVAQMVADYAPYADEIKSWVGLAKARMAN